MKKENTSESESYKKINLETYYRKGSFTNFSEGPKCSLSVTSKIDVTDLYNWSKKCGTKFYINFLYTLSKVLNSHDDYKMEYRCQTEEPRIRLMMPLTVRMNHAIADGYQVAKVFELVRKECENLTRENS